MTTVDVPRAPEAKNGSASSTIRSAVAAARASFDWGTTRPAAWRLAQLDGLSRFLKEREAEVLDALAADVGKPKLEAYSTEVAYTLSEIGDAKRSLGNRRSSATSTVTSIGPLPRRTASTWASSAN